MSSSQLLNELRVADTAPWCAQTATRSRSVALRSATGVLVIAFVLTLPLVNPWVRGDGVGYYAYVRALLIEHSLDFQNDWRAANTSFTMGRVRPGGTIDAKQYTRTGHLDNHFAVGASMLWAPFEAPVHWATTALHKLGWSVQPNGFSRPYIIAMAMATALYGFLGLYFSFRFAAKYMEERWALLATIGIWFASSLPVYMYFNPSWSHAHSAFIVAFFLWYWQRTQPGRTISQWLLLGLLSGVVLDVYYINVAVLLVPFMESMQGYWRSLRQRNWSDAGRLLAANVLYCFATVFAFLPTLISRKIIYGHPLDFGYREVNGWALSSPHLFAALFSSEHGALVWTPILSLALIGLALFLRRNPTIATYLLVVFAVFAYLIGGDPNWAGISSFGNRFFISLTPLYVLGMAVLFSEIAKAVENRRTALLLAGSLTAALIAWNLAFIFQWGTHMVPARGPISWSRMVRNQFTVPQRAVITVDAYLHDRKALMQQIEQQDLPQLQDFQSHPE
jgi:hypothetical protein